MPISEIVLSSCSMAVSLSAGQAIRHRRSSLSKPQPDREHPYSIAASLASSFDKPVREQGQRKQSQVPMTYHPFCDHMCALRLPSGLADSERQMSMSGIIERA